MSTAQPSMLAVASDPEYESLAELFHRVGRLLPEDQEVLRVPPNMPAYEALKLMQENAFSQLPVVEGDEVLGIFSYRSFSVGVARMERGRDLPGDLPVEEFVEPTEFTRVTDEFTELLGHLNSLDAVLVGNQKQLQGIITAMNFLEYLYKVTSPFVLLNEIELALRALIQQAVNQQELSECIENSLSHHYGPEKLPNQLDEMNFGDYLLLVTNGRNWPKFQSVFGGTRDRVRARLEPIRRLRNDVFHFRREIKDTDRMTLSDCRNWLLIRARTADARQRR